MARQTFGRGINEWVSEFIPAFEEPGPEEEPTPHYVTLMPGNDVTFWTHRVGGQRISNLLNRAGEIQSSFSADVDGRLPYFYGPDTTPETSYLWAQSGAGPRSLILSNEAYRYADVRVRDTMDIINSVDDAQETIEDLNEVANQRDEILDNISDTFERLQVAQSRYQDLIFSPRRGQVVFWGVRNPNFPGGTQNLPNGSVQVPIQFNQVHHNFGVWNGTTPQNVVIQLTGKYMLYGVSSFLNNNTGTRREHQMTLDGSAIEGTNSAVRNTVSAEWMNPPTSGVPVDINAGQVLNLRQIHDASISITTSGNPTYAPNFIVVYLGPQGS